MWKIAVGFVVFAGLALFILSMGGEIDMGGEKHGGDPGHTPVVVESASVAAPASTTASVVSAPKTAASK